MLHTLHNQANLFKDLDFVSCCFYSVLYPISTQSSSHLFIKIKKLKGNFIILPKMCDVQNWLLLEV